jgi:glucose/arabinose dehydrogenase
VVEQPGRIRIVRDGRLLERPFLDITDRVGCCGERGLLGLAFPPGDGSAFFVDYTDRDGTTAVSRFQVSEDDPDVADPTTERVVLRVGQPYANHNGGMIAFGPDGYLYVATGDGGSGGDPQGNGQDSPPCSVLRIDVVGITGEPYAVPPDNPFVGVAKAADEIWASGLRNPWRFSFDRLTGDLWIGDVGQGTIEEIDRARAVDGGGRGANYGWNVMEGTRCFSPAKGCRQTGLTLPIAQYGHGHGCAVSGGYVYRGTAQPALAGVYLFADYCTGRIWGLSSGGPDSQAPVELSPGAGNIASFGEDDAGELYVADIAAGTVLRVAAGPVERRRHQAGPDRERRDDRDRHLVGARLDRGQRRLGHRQHAAAAAHRARHRPCRLGDLQHVAEATPPSMARASAFSGVADRGDPAAAWPSRRRHSGRRRRQRRRTRRQASSMTAPVSSEQR